MHTSHPTRDRITFLGPSGSLQGARQQGTLPKFLAVKANEAEPKAIQMWAGPRYVHRRGLMLCLEIERLGFNTSQRDLTAFPDAKVILPRYDSVARNILMGVPLTSQARVKVSRLG